MTKIEEKVENLIKDTVNNLGYRVYDVMYVKEGKDNYLKIFIDNDNGISLEDCENVNNAITDMLDEANYIKDQYFLEISSPGIERIIRREEHLKENIDQEIYIRTFNKIEELNSKEIIGILNNLNEQDLIIDIDNKKINIKRKDIALIKKTYKW